jgi:hypothetical protein
MQNFAVLKTSGSYDWSLRDTQVLHQALVPNPPNNVPAGKGRRISGISDGNHRSVRFTVFLFCSFVLPSLTLNFCVTENKITLHLFFVGLEIHFFFLKDPIYLQSVIIHSANGGKGEGLHVEEYSVALLC